MLRDQIDAMDAAIIRLVAERARLSQRIQTARMNAGGTRVELGRERVILDGYRAGLGPDGPQLADAVLQVCRGRCAEPRSQRQQSCGGRRPSGSAGGGWTAAACAARSTRASRRS